MTPTTTEPDSIATGRWLYILVQLVVMHVLIDARYRLAALFPSPPVGFVVMATAFAVMALALVLWKPSPGGLWARFDSWIRATLSPFLTGRPINRPIAWVVIVLMTVAGCLLRWLYISRTSIDANTADMLPLIQKACAALTSGHNPYGSEFALPWRLPLTYWPGLWLPYLIPHSLGVDFRWIHIGVVLAMAVLFGSFMTQSLKDPYRGGVPLLLAAFSGLFLFLFSSEFIFFAGIAHTPPLWLWVSLLALAIVTKRPLLSAIFLGLVLASRQPCVGYAPLVAIYWLRTSGSLRTVLKLTAVTAGVYLLICGPFLLLDPFRFVVAPLHYYTKMSQLDFMRGANGYCAETIGFTYMLRSMHIEELRSACTALAFLAPLGLGWKYLRSEVDLLLCIGLAGIAVTLTCPTPWHYEYFPSLLVISFAAIAATYPSGEKQVRQ